MQKINNLVYGCGTILLMSLISSGCSLKKDTTITPTPISIETELETENSVSVIEETPIDTLEDQLSITPAPTLTLPLENEIFVDEKTKDDSEYEYVALTFDDGPSKYTDELVDLLNDYNVQATFFVLGYNCKNYPDALTKIIDSGHEIAIHGETHTSFTKLTLEQVNAEITNTTDYIESLGFTASPLVRPPYGSLNEELKQGIDYPFILWSIDTEDWKTKDKEQIKAEIIDNIEAGSIILMHDTSAVHEVNMEVLREILPELTEEYHFVTVSDLANYYDKNLESGKAYGKIKQQ